MKYLLLAALLILLLLLVYSRVHPYVKALRKLLATVRSVAGGQPGQSGGPKGSAIKAESKLVKCVECGTWIPADRAIGAGKGSSVYCSRECLEKPPKRNEAKLAG